MSRPYPGQVEAIMAGKQAEFSGPVTYEHRGRVVDANGRPVADANFGQPTPEMMDAEIQERLAQHGEVGTLLGSLLAMPDGPAKQAFIESMNAALQAGAGGDGATGALARAAREAVERGEDGHSDAAPSGVVGQAGGAAARHARVERPRGDSAAEVIR